mmetsp:Transcript_35867/g.75039  ORF Transcript_35867/g.75039 Transcript_35867/m.75039 type:complete len:102 (+) Transcript_35867:1531-1836(+)
MNILTVGKDKILNLEPISFSSTTLTSASVILTPDSSFFNNVAAFQNRSSVIDLHPAKAGPQQHDMKAPTLPVQALIFLCMWIPAPMLAPYFYSVYTKEHRT